MAADPPFKEKLQSLQFTGGKRGQGDLVIDGVRHIEDIGHDGETVGFHSHHADGHVDAQAFVPPTELIPSSTNQ